MKIAIFGLARSGLAALKYLTTTEHQLYLVNKGAPKTWSAWEEVHSFIDKDLIDIDHCFDQEDAQDMLAEMEQIILSPGIARSHPALKKALKLGVAVISEIEFAFIHSDIPVVAITGTNGKTTTATMVAQALEGAGKKVFLGGNIGRAYSEILLSKENFDYAVIEVSSFQLESIETFHPQIAMLLNISANHTERYDSIDDYAHAKYNIFKNMQTCDHALIDVDLDVSGVRATVHYIKSLESLESLESFDFSKSNLVGSHNYQNFYCAWKVLKLLNIDNATSVMQKFIDTFPGVKYRLQYVGNFEGLKFYNDAKSTNSAATESAVRAFQNNSSEALYLILGGKLRSDKVDILDKLQGLNITEIFVMGEAKDLLEKNLCGEFQVKSFDNLTEVFNMIRSKKLKGSLLFSPAFPSFDQYKDYEERGEDFFKKVKEIL